MSSSDIELWASIDSNPFCSDWDRIKSPAADQIVPYDSLPTPTNHENLEKLAVLKVNGGLGTSMGMCPLQNAS